MHGRPMRFFHPAFEWDDKVAAEGYRKEQARDLIRSVIVTSERMAIPTRAFVIISEFGEQGYTSVDIALTTPNLRQQVLKRALMELRQWEARYRELQELAEVFAAVAKVQKAA